MAEEKDLQKNDEESSLTRKEDEEEVSEQEIEEVVDELKRNPKFASLSEDQLKEIVRISIFKAERYSGPLPHPAFFDGYEKTLPGAANRILEMAEENATNRHTLNERIVDSDIMRSNRGQILGFILSVLFIGAAIVGIYLKQPIPASVLGIGGFSSIVSIFVLGKK